jgi:hypothetical protein
MRYATTDAAVRPEAAGAHRLATLAAGALPAARDDDPTSPRLDLNRHHARTELDQALLYQHPVRRNDASGIRERPHQRIGRARAPTSPFVDLTYPNATINGAISVAE